MERLSLAAEIITLVVRCARLTSVEWWTCAYSSSFSISLHVYTNMPVHEIFHACTVFNIEWTRHSSWCFCLFTQWARSRRSIRMMMGVNRWFWFFTFVLCKIHKYLSRRGSIELSFYFVLLNTSLFKGRPTDSILFSFANECEGSLNRRHAWEHTVFGECIYLVLEDDLCRSFVFTANICYVSD